jgi:hypothetical protein
MERNEVPDFAPCKVALAFEDSEGLFDWVEIWRVAGQWQHRMTGCGQTF